jgi:molybdenum cofactor biosynthesis enzyme MoaA
MKADTYTIIAGNMNCPNNCPICISKMTPEYSVGKSAPVVNWSRFEDATKMAIGYGAKNVLITGKGEPTLFPAEITQYLIKLKDKAFLGREIQTSGIMLAKSKMHEDYMDVWKDLGLTAIALSMYHYDNKKNTELFHPEIMEESDKNPVGANIGKRVTKGYDLEKLIGKINSKGINVRLSCVMMKGYVDSVDEVNKLIDYAKKNNVYQLTLRRVDFPADSRDQGVVNYIKEHKLSVDEEKTIADYIQANGRFCYSLSHSAKVFELNGQNVCLSTGLTKADEKDDCVRQLIFFPQGWLTTSWENVQGGRLL